MEDNFTLCQGVSVGVRTLFFFLNFVISSGGMAEGLYCRKLLM